LQPHHKLHTASDTKVAVAILVNNLNAMLDSSSFIPPVSSMRAETFSKLNSSRINAASGEVSAESSPKLGETI
jgi:hypothetical protein